MTIVFICNRYRRRNKKSILSNIGEPNRKIRYARRLIVRARGEGRGRISLSEMKYLGTENVTLDRKRDRRSPSSHLRSSREHCRYLYRGEIYAHLAITPGLLFDLARGGSPDRRGLFAYYGFVTIDDPVGASMNILQIYAETVILSRPCHLSSCV